jgi:hypothetical protein
MVRSAATPQSLTGTPRSGWRRGRSVCRLDGTLPGLAARELASRRLFYAGSLLFPRLALATEGGNAGNNPAQTIRRVKRASKNPTQKSRRLVGPQGYEGTGEAHH